jgi:hypothetical protein
MTDLFMEQFENTNDMSGVGMRDFESGFRNRFFFFCVASHLSSLMSETFISEIFSQMKSLISQYLLIHEELSQTK